MPTLITARISNVTITEDMLTVDLEDGRTLSVPIGWYPRLSHGTAEERANWEISAAGYWIHWRDLDEDLGVQGLMLGKKSVESAQSFERWLAKREKKLEELTLKRINDSLKAAPPDQAELERLKKMQEHNRRIVKGMW